MKPILDIPGYRKAYEVAARYGSDGCTAWEVHKATGAPLSTAQNRLRELTKRGKLRLGDPTGDRERMGNGGREFVDTFVAIGGGV